jgi:heme-degrading monooxygenase HmoA
MAIVRLIFVKVKPEDAGAAERLWKEECAPLMIGQEGCLSEELLRAAASPGEYISYSVWDSLEAVERYRASDAHAKIKAHALRLRTLEPPSVGHYELV